MTYFAIRINSADNVVTFGSTHISAKVSTPIMNDLVYKCIELTPDRVISKYNEIVILHHYASIAMRFGKIQ